MIKNINIAILGTLFLISCSGGSGGNEGGDPTNPTPDPVPTTVPVAPGDGDTVIIGSAGICNAGEIARVDLGAGSRSRFSLVSEENVCSPTKDNRKEEYTLILYNTTESAISFRLDSPLNESPIETPNSLIRNNASHFNRPVEAPLTREFNQGPSEMNREASFAYQLSPPNKYDYGQSQLNAGFSSMASLSQGDELEFRVRSNPGNADEFVTNSAILRAQGTNINLFVDRDIPIGGLNADSPTQVQLDRLVEIFDNNTYPLITSILGDESDVDNDDRIHVVITPVLNRNLKVASYVDSRNVLPYNSSSNRGSNEAEVIFIFAPDSLGNYDTFGNSYNAERFFDDKILNGWIAFQFPKIISFNQHVLVSGGTAESDWIDDGIGAVMANLTGFNIFHQDAYSYLMAPQLDNLKESEDLDQFFGQGAEYLFMSYYMQSQLDDTFEDSNGDGIDDDISFLGDLMTSGITGVDNLEAAIEVDFDENSETEFDAIFKDWNIAMVTSGSGRTDLQVSGQDAVKYYLNYNSSALGTGIVNSGMTGSSRVGADGGVLDPDGIPNLVGLDLNALDIEEDILFENADEHVYAPGNAMQGFVDSNSAMFVRISGMFQEAQTIALFSSSQSLQGFLVKRSNINYPKTYSESVFGATNQLFENLDSPGPNSYWTGEGFAKKVDIESLIADSAVNGVSPGFVSIIGNIDDSDSVEVCPEDEDNCGERAVVDTDKYIFTVPDLARGDEGEIAIAVRRRFSESSDESSLNPILAVVSSKDVPYPYVPHPIRNEINGTGTTDTRQQYRWVTSKLICGDGEEGSLTNVSGAACTDGDDGSRIVFEDGLVENTGNLSLSSGTWSGNISGGDCNAAPTEPFGVETAGTGYGSNISYPVTSIETSGSSLGKYLWSDSFMTFSYSGNRFPDRLFEREFLKSGSGYPSVDIDNLYDPRSINLLSLNCNAITDGEADEAPDSPDDFLEPSELRSPGSLAEQILVEMSRYRFASDGTPESARLAVQYDDNDVFAIDGDSRDTDSICTTSDLTHNMNTYTVRSGEGSIVWGNDTLLIDHVRDDLNASPIEDANQNIYTGGGEVFLTMTPGKNYTLIVGGTGGTVGDYEIRIRKISNISKNVLVLKNNKGGNEECRFEN